MKSIIQFRINKGAEYYVAEGIDVPVVTQALTLDELAKNIQEATELCFEGEDPAMFGFNRLCWWILNYHILLLIPRPKLLSGKEVLDIFEKFGFLEVSQKKKSC